MRGVMARVLVGLAVIALTFGLPLLGAPSALTTGPLLLGMATGFLLLVLQPMPSKREVTAIGTDDRGSMLGILAAQIACQGVAVVEFGYSRGSLWTAPTQRLLAGMALVTLGLGLRTWAIWRLGQYFTPVVQLHEGHRLVTGGPYRFVRHPSYSGALACALGVVLASGSPLGVVAFVAVLVPAYTFRIWVEERALRKVLGAEYAVWVRRTPALVPGMRIGRVE